MADPLTPPALIVQAEAPLAELASQISAAHADALQSARTSLEHARRAGDLLQRAKKRLGHGRFMAWVEANCPFRRSTAGNYMKVARSWEKIQAAGDSPGTIAVALAAIAGPEPVENYQPDGNSGASGCLELLLDAGLIEDADDLVGFARLTLGGLETDLRLDGQAPPLENADGMLNALRVEDLPPVYAFRMPFSSPCPDAVTRACGLFLGRLAAAGGKVPAWELAGWWWGCQAAMSPEGRRHLPMLLVSWHERFCGSLAWLCVNGGTGPDGLDDEASKEWWGHRSDLRHAGALRQAEALAGKAGEEWAPPSDNPLWDACCYGLDQAIRTDGWTLPTSVLWQRRPAEQTDNRDR